MTNLGSNFLHNLEQKSLTQKKTDEFWRCNDQGCVGGGFGSGALDGDPTGTIRENSAANATTNLGIEVLVHFQQKGIVHGICDEFLHWHKKGRL